jgi:hypothetical protein
MGAGGFTNELFEVIVSNRVKSVTHPNRKLVLIALRQERFERLRLIKHLEVFVYPSHRKIRHVCLPLSDAFAS